MTTETLDLIFKTLFQGNQLQEDYVIVWHAGEPLVMPIQFYENAVSIAEKYNYTGQPIRHSIQTNATLITDEWCKFFQQMKFDVGVSIDGPHHIHDRYRVRRNGAGTFNDVMTGINKLKTYQIPFGAISVITRYALDFPDQIYEFFLDLGCREVSFNIDEIIGSNEASTMKGANAISAYHSFISHLYYRAKQDNFRLRITNFADMHANLLGNAVSRHLCTIPFQVISFDWEGNFSTFSPDLFTWQHTNYQFKFGNVREGALEEMLYNPAYQAVAHEIEEGVQLCQNTCEYFSICGGGDPSSKLGEYGNMAVSEHLRCRFVVKTVADIVLTELTQEFQT